MLGPDFGGKAMSEVTYTEAEIEKIKDRILEALEMVIDPELGIDIVNQASFTTSVLSRMVPLRLI